MYLTCSANDCEASGSRELKVCGGCKVARYCSKVCQKRSWKLHKKECSLKATVKESKARESDVVNLYEIVDIPGKGKGLIATTDIPAGTLIIREKPLLRVLKGEEESIKEKVESLSTEEREKFMDLHNCHPPDASNIYHEIWSTNSMDGDEKGSNVFTILSRINHSCRSNVIWCWTSSLGEQFLVAKRDISEGQEIVASYIEARTKTRAERRELLKKLWRFDCECEVCSASRREVSRSDVVRKKYLKLRRDVSFCRSDAKGVKMCKECRNIIRLEFDNCPAELAVVLTDEWQLLHSLGKSRKADKTLIESVRLTALAWTKKSGRFLAGKRFWEKYPSPLKRGMKEHKNLFD